MSNLKGISHTLFNRSWRVTIDTIETTELDCQFKVTKSLKPEPNKCELKIFNMSEDQRAQIEELNPKTKDVSGLAKKKVKIAARKGALTGIPCKIEAGYNGEMSLLWLGDMRTSDSVIEGPDWVTSVDSGDGEKAWANARIHVSYGPKTPSDVVLKAMVKELGVGQGNLAKAIASLKKSGIATLPQGSVFSGPVSRELTDFCRSADLEWSIQDGAIQFLDRGVALANTAVLVSADTGMLGSPTVDIDGILKVKILMTPDVRPGRLLQVKARRVEGGYKCEKCIYVGDTFGGDWTIEIEARRYSA